MGTEIKTIKQNIASIGHERNSWPGNSLNWSMKMEKSTGKDKEMVLFIEKNLRKIF